jgi:hypothetical protein
LISVNNISFKFNFAESSFNKVVKATDLFNQGITFALYDCNKEFVLYMPLILAIVDNHNDRMLFTSLPAMQAQLGIHLMCFDYVMEVELQTLVEDLKLIE